MEVPLGRRQVRNALNINGLLRSCIAEQTTDPIIMTQEAVRAYWFLRLDDALALKRFSNQLISFRRIRPLANDKDDQSFCTALLGPSAISAKSSVASSIP
jgi:hypothetical protein